MGRKSGFTLLETAVAALFIALMAAAFMSTALTSQVSGARVQRRLAAAAATRRLAEHLKAYVTADRGLVNGPGVGGDGWSLPGDLSGLTALAPGRHPLDAGAWAPGLPGATIFYDVAEEVTPSGRRPTATFSVSWEDP